MNPSENRETKERPAVRGGPRLEKDHGFFNSATVAVSPLEIFHFCQSDHNLKKALENLPLGIENFLDLNLKSAEQTGTDEFQIVWNNRPGARFGGTITFLLTKAPADRGTIVTTEANFKKLNLKDEKPSTLIHIFLKRVKSLIECGEIATTKGQPSGREEIGPTDSQTLH